MRQSREFNHELRIIGASQGCFIVYDVVLEIKTFFTFIFLITKQRSYFQCLYFVRSCFYIYNGFRNKGN